MSDPSQVERLARIRDLFEDALLLAGDERSAFLDKACGEDEDLRAEVASLLMETDSVDSPLDGLVSDMIWPALKSLSGDASKLEDWLDDRLNIRFRGSGSADRQDGIALRDSRAHRAGRHGDGLPCPRPRA